MGVFMKLRGKGMLAKSAPRSCFTGLEETPCKISNQDLFVTQMCIHVYGYIDIYVGGILEGKYFFVHLKLYKIPDTLKFSVIILYFSSFKFS